MNLRDAGRGRAVFAIVFLVLAGGFAVWRMTGSTPPPEDSEIRDRANEIRDRMHDAADDAPAPIQDEGEDGGARGAGPAPVDG